jgi:hypothetical protein
LAAGVEGSFDMIRKSDIYGDDSTTNSGPALQLPNNPLKNSAGQLAGYYQGLIGKGFNSILSGAFFEANMPFHDLLTVLASIRVDGQQWTVPMISPRIALISAIDNKNVIKAIVQQSVRMNMLPEVWEAHIMDSLRGQKDNNYEKLLGVELAYTGIIGENFNLNISGFYNSINALGWSMINDTTGSTALLGTENIAGLEAEGKYSYKNITASLNQSYTKLVSFKNANPSQTSGLSIADYNVPATGVNTVTKQKDTMYLTSTGMDLNNWANLQTKFAVMDKLSKNFTLGVDGVVFWKYEGIEDALNMYDKAYASQRNSTSTSAINSTQLDTLQGLVNSLRSQGAGNANCKLNVTLKYQLPIPEKDAFVKIYWMNMLDAFGVRFHRYFNATRVDGQTPYRIGWVNEPWSLGMAVTVKF